MAAKGCTVRVSGLPTDVEEDRLTDKLYIHFLRGKHGGGEVTAVKIHKAMPGSALITFEDSKVARNVVRYGKHVLLVDDKKYELTVSFPSKEVDPDQVFLCMMVTVDYSWLPLGKEAVTSLHQSLPDVHCSFSLLEQHCTLKGRYSEVQALVTQLLGIVETHVSSDTHSSGTSSVCGSVDHPNNIRELGETTQSKQASGLDLDSLCSISPESPTHSQALEDTGDTEKTTPLRDDPLLEDHSLAMDADIFRYLRQHYGEEYQRILSQHGVEVVDMTARDVTTLFLNARAGGKGRGMQQVQQVQQVHAQISRLYQETEAQLCKEQLPKEHAPKENLQLALEVLQLRLPKVQLGVDDRHISIVGSSSDVLEAKQFLLDQQEEEGDTKPGRAGHDFPPAVSGLDSRVGKMLKTYRGGRTEGGREYKLAARFREAQSKNSGEDGLGIRLSNTMPHGNTMKDSSPTLWQKSGTKQILGNEPVLGGGQMLGTGGAQSGKDILFKKIDPLVSRPCLGSALSDTVLPSENLQFTTPPSIVHQMDLFSERKIQTSAIPHSESGLRTNLRRTNSFSGPIRPKQGLMETDSGVGGSLEKPNSTRTNSSASSRESRDVYSAEVKAPTLMWQYMKEAYRTRIEDMTSELKIKEKQLESGVTLVLRGVNPSKVDTCQQELQELVAMVATDFYVQELPLANLSVADPEDETLDMCCAEVRRRFRKVKIELRRESLFIIGPKELCVQVGGALMEVFHNGAEKSKRHEEKLPELEGLSDTSHDTHTKQVTSQLKTKHTQYEESTPKSHTALKGNSLQSRSLSLVDSPQNKLGREMGLGNKKGKDNIQQIDSTRRSKNDSGGRREKVSPSAAQKEPVFKHKLGKGGPKEEEDHRIDKTLTHSSESSRKAVQPADSGLLSLPTLAYDTQKAVMFKKESNLKPRSSSKLTQKETQHSPTSPERLEGEEMAHQNSSKSESTQEESWTNEAVRQSCVCGATGVSLTRTACGVALCPKCLLAHVYCRVCPGVEEVRGIRGTMRWTELPLSLPGHIKDTTLKITYTIPDGLQGVSHPAPGDPFQGGIFEAYLPLNEQTRRLLPQLKRAFTEGLLFTVAAGDRGCRVVWDSVPHKTRVDGGKSGNGYPDSGYLRRLTEALKSLGIEDGRAMSESQDKIKK